MTKTKFDSHDIDDLPRAGGGQPAAPAEVQDVIKIAHSVVASIVRLATLEIEGVHAVGSDRFMDGLVEMLSKRENDRGVKVTEETGVDDQCRYFIEIHIILRYGFELAKVAQKIQANVRAKVVHMTGNPVAKIDVHVDGVRLDTPAATEPDWHGEPHTD